MFKKFLLGFICAISFVFALFPQTNLFSSNFICGTAKIPLYKKLIELFLPSSNKKEEVLPSGKFVYVSGYPIGFSIDGAGAVVVERSAVITNDGYKMIAEDAGIEIGDIIKKVNERQITSGITITEEVNKEENIGKPVKLTINRGGIEIIKEIMPEYDIFAGGLRLGLWVRDNAVGVGMMTYIEENGEFGALGHPITDIDTGAIIPIADGKVYKCSIIGAKKGEKGTPGELKGLFLKTSNTIGSAVRNEKVGVFGRINEENISNYSYKKLEVARPEEVQMGEAVIVTTIDGVIPKEYRLEIVKTNYTSENGEKCMVIRIIDDALIEATGGIVQGMSGSPIIQNNKIIGAVTHVFVNDPKKGFASFITSMIDIEAH